MKVFDCDTCKFRKLFVNIPSRALRKYLNNNKHSTSRKGLQLWRLKCLQPQNK